MIPKSEILEVASETGLFPSTVEKDYALSWALAGIAAHSELRHWVFKGGTCLKKCWFETYRFSEDLDFSVPEGRVYTPEDVRRALRDLGDRVYQQVGLEFPHDGIEIEPMTNRRGRVTMQARVTFVGPLQLPRNSRQRIKFDLTNDELIADATELRKVDHAYSDAPAPAAEVSCYSLHELLAEKTRALYEREGRARDVYDVVNVGRNFLQLLDVGRLAGIIRRKFAFKELPAPTAALIRSRINPDTLAVDWTNALKHQLPVLPDVTEFLAALEGILDAFLGGRPATPVLQPVPAKAGESPVERVLLTGRRFASLGRGAAVSTGAIGPVMDRVRFAARNRLLASVSYHGVTRLVEPYSLRLPGTRNLLLYVYEVQRGGSRGGGIKAYKVAELGHVEATAAPFSARYVVEL
jgi:predicted nucleotidyltransferase component of viral defense system